MVDETCFMKKSFGENNIVQYDWNVYFLCDAYIEESLVQLNFQTVRIQNNKDIFNIINNFKFILSYLYYQINCSQNEDKIKFIQYLILLYKFIAYTRDIISGKGERFLSYLFIFELYNYYPELSKYIVSCLIKYHDNTSIHPYGSFKDIKYLCSYIYSINNKNSSHPLVYYSINLLCNQLKEDILILNSYNITNELLYNENDEDNENNKNGEKKNKYKKLSLVSKWIPRENSSKKFNWIFEELSKIFFSNYLTYAITSRQREKAIRKCKTELRKTISYLNKKIETIQVKQCSHNKSWKNINPTQITSITLRKQWNSLLNINKNNKQKYGDNNNNSDEDDRIICRNNIIKFINNGSDKNTEINGKRISIFDFVNDAIELLDALSIIKKEKQEGENIQEKEENIIIKMKILDLQWKNNRETQNYNMGKYIPVIDLSSSMSGTPLYNAIGIGIRIAEKSLLGKRVITFSSNPTWINLEDVGDSFVKMVNTIKSSNMGLNSDLYKVFQLFLNAIIESGLSPEETGDFELVILSDMQTDCFNFNSNLTLFDSIQKMYLEVGMKSIFKKSFKIPSIIFWNLRITDGFPCMSKNNGSIMISGYSPVIMNSLFKSCNYSSKYNSNYVSFLEKTSNNNITPYKHLLKQLNNERYDMLERKVMSVYNICCDT